MDERDVKMANLRAENEGQQETIRQLTTQIDEAIAEMKKTKAMYEEIRERYTRLVSGIMEMIDKIRGES